jgi:2-methylcitrate dehydratase PrpD
VLHTPVAGATRSLATFAAETPTASLPDSALGQARRLTLDTVGVALGAAGLPPAQKVIAEVASWGGTPEASILATPHRTSAVQAAYVNAYLANLLDADETLLNYAHLANAIVPSALAAAERVGASGRDLLAAVAVGYEVAARIATACRIWRLVDGQLEWSPVAGYSWVIFGVTAAAGRLLGLSADQMTSAFGIAGYSATIPSIGKWVDSRNLPHTKYVFLGPLAHAGVASALLARQGLEGDDDVLEGERGFWRMAGSDACDWDAMTRDLGREWLLDQVSYKLYPACRFLHAPLDLFRDLITREDLSPDEIEGVVVGLPPAATRPYFVNPEPAHVVEGSFSVPHAFACVAHRLPVGPEWHRDESLQRADLARFRRRVEVAVEPRATPVLLEQLTAGEGASYYRRCPTSLEVSARGRVYRGQAEYASGDPWEPATRLDDAALEEKFVSYVGPGLGLQRAHGLVDQLRRLEHLPDVRTLDLAVNPTSGLSSFTRS